MKPIELDGTTGEGGGQLVRVAVGLAALTSQAVVIRNVRGNRAGPRGGGLKSQHVTSIKWLAEVTGADVEGLSVGSKTLSFNPRHPPTRLSDRSFKIPGDSGAASTLLILQAIFPFLLFAGNDGGDPIELEIAGGTNVSFSLSYEYLDQILLSTLEERFGICVERNLKQRGWSLGPQSTGSISIKLHPLKLGQVLPYKPREPYKGPDAFEVERIDASVIVPRHSHETVQNALVKDLGDLFPGVDIAFKATEDSRHDSRWYIILVAISKSGIRWGKDVLTSMPKKTKSKDVFVSQLCRRLCQDLYEEVSMGGQVDEHLQDQVVCFQALCQGCSAFIRDGEPNGPTDPSIDVMGDGSLGDGRMREEKTHEPFGYGSLHTKTARWVASKMLPEAKFYRNGLVKGIGLTLS